MVEDKISTMRIKESTKVMLDPYRLAYGSYEKAVIKLIEMCEGNE